MSRPEFKVWDANSDEKWAEVIQAGDPHEAAEVYAEQDVDGNIDGIYHSMGQPVMVREEDGTLHKFMVTVEYDPIYRAEKVK